MLKRSPVGVAWFAVVLATALDPRPGVLAGPAAPLTSPTADESKLVRLMNQERAAMRLPPLRWDTELAGLARLHAADMRATGTISHHSSADGADFAARLARTDYRASKAAENVALDDSVDHAHRGLMNSPGHRRNILDEALTAVGVGILRSKDGALYVVEDFATRLPDLGDREATAKFRVAIARVRGQGRHGPLEEDRELSRSLEKSVRRLIDDDSVAARSEDGFASGWVLAYTTQDPSTLPQDAVSKIGKAQAYALALRFAKSRSYPFGVWWVVLALKQ